MKKQTRVGFWTWLLGGGWCGGGSNGSALAWRVQAFYEFSSVV